MKTDFKPHRLDVMAFAEATAKLEGTLPLTDLPRLAAGLHQPESSAPVPLVHWLATGSLHTIRGGGQQARLHLQVDALAPLECQRCLDTVHTALAVDRDFVFAASEEAAAKLDEEEEDDVLVLSRHFDLLELVEDELLLTLPVVPRHERCPRSLTPGREVAPPLERDADADARPNPFAVLASLKAAKGDD